MADARADSAVVLIASALEGAWRREPPPPALSEERLARVAPLLSGSGASALAWWKLRRSSLCETREALEFKQSYRLQALKDAVREREVESLFALLDAAGVEAVLVKGWAAARAYPEPGLRPAGDIDLCVRPAQFVKAKDVLASPEGRRFWVDLHEGFATLLDGRAEELFGRSRVLPLGASRVRVLAEEDHLRLLCFHLLRHGAWRPLWLCDVAAAIESRAEDFDWRRLLGADVKRERWVVCAAGLAARLLGARLEGTPLAPAARSLPRWLLRGVSKQWETPFAACQPPLSHRAPMRKYLRRPRGILGDLRKRWPNPISATVDVCGPFNALPRLPFQLACGLSRTAAFLARVNAESRRAPHFL
ncbi:MAG: nucleotidyltransferase family protein [Pyrinomonadaceae bacterium]